MFLAGWIVGDRHGESYADELDWERNHRRPRGRRNVRDFGVRKHNRHPPRPLLDVLLGRRCGRREQHIRGGQARAAEGARGGVAEEELLGGRDVPCSHRGGRAFPSWPQQPLGVHGHEPGEEDPAWERGGLPSGAREPDRVFDGPQWPTSAQSRVHRESGGVF